MPATRPSRALSDDDKSEMLHFFALGDHQHLRAVLTALVNDPKLGAAVLDVMKRDILPYMGTDMSDFRMATKVKRLVRKWGVAGDRLEPGHLGCSRLKKSLCDAPLWCKAYPDGKLVKDPDVSTHSIADPVERFLQWSVTPEAGSGSPSALLSTARATKKRKIRESSSYQHETPPTPVSQAKPTPPMPVCRKSLPVSKAVRHPPTRSANEKAVPLETVARRIMERASNGNILQTSFTDNHEGILEDLQLSRPENPVASVLAGHDHNSALPPRRTPCPPKPVVLKRIPAAKALSLSPSRVALMTERRLSLRPRVARATGSK
ncbi:hypothetical protein BC835DRAFT_1303486 [Cytidiella melzeri]|nr:hypothetical protein BC835DRAFT_1303486 [Cytidiella melzeri]